MDPLRFLACIMVLWLSCALLAAGCCDAPEKNRATESDREVFAKMSAIFDKTLESSGTNYLQYEHQLLEGGEPETSQMLSQRLGDPDPMVRLTAQAFLDGKGQWARYHKEASAWLGGIADRPKWTLASDPTPQTLARSLSLDFKDHVANFLAVKLVKDVKEERREVSPKWLKQGVILYLQQQKKPSTTAGLIRFAEETNDPQLRDSAIDAIRSIPDPELSGKIEAERKRAQAQGKELPPALDALRNTGPK